MSIDQHPTPTRRAALVFAAAGCLPLVACGVTGRAKTVRRDFVLFSYLPKPIYEVLVNGRFDANTDGYPETGGKTITGAEFRAGPQRVTWRWADTGGATVVAKNEPLLPEIPKDAQFIALYIYPDETVEFLPSRHYPVDSPRGEIEAQKIDAQKIGGGRGK